jgi:hypothetical protein
MKRILSLAAFVAINVSASYAPVAVCVWLFPTIQIAGNMFLSKFLYFPVLFAELVFWLSGFSINGRAPSDWIFLSAFLLAIVLISVLFQRVKRAWFWVPFILFWICLFQDISAIEVRGC